jgi:hypothetical protein
MSVILTPEAETMKGNLVYLGTPYTKYQKGIECAFVDAATITARLLLAGIKVYSPIVHCHPLSVHGKIDPLDYKIWLPFNEAMLIACDVLVVAHLEGWDRSYGVGEEIKFFEESRKPIFDLDPVTLLMVRRTSTKPVRERIDDLPLNEVESERRRFLGHADPGAST